MITTIGLNDTNFSSFTENEWVTDITDPAGIGEPNGNVTYVDEYMEQLANALNVYYTPVLVVLGCLGNLISVIVFYKSKLRLQSTSHYLSALAVSDTLFLFQLLPPWLKAVDASNVFTKNIFCQGFVYMSYVCSNHSSWLVVAFTVERFVAVVYPLRRNAMCTVKRARHIILSLALFALLINLPVLRFAVPSRNDCNIDYEFLEHAARFNLFDTMASFTIPLTMIIVLNAWIMTDVYRLGRERTHLVKEQSTEAGGRRVSRAVSWQRSQQRVTRMLLIVSSVFVLLNLPAYAMRIYAYANNMSENEYSGKVAALQQICLMFFNSNFGINFFLYCMSGQNFRRALCQTFPLLRRRTRTRRGGRHAASHRNCPLRPASVSTSYVSQNTQTEATTGTGAASGSGAPGGEPSGGRGPGKRRRRQRVVRRWRFDNSRQQQQVGIEMTLRAPADI